MNLFKKGDSPYWHYRFMVQGKRYRGSTKRKTQAEANRVMMAEYKKVMDNRQHGEKPELTLKDAMQATVDSVSGSTRRSYDLSMRKWLGLMKPGEGLWHLDARRYLSSLSDGDLEAHRKARQREGLKPNSINIEIRFIKRVVNLNTKKAACPRDLDFVMQKSFSKSRIISPDEEASIVAYCLAREAEFGGGAWQKAHDLFIYLIETGVRLGEALGVEWADIDRDAKVIDNWNHKTQKAVYVPISDRLGQVLLRLNDQQKPFLSMDKAQKNLRAAITACCKSSQRVMAEKGKATIHSCRDTYATRMLNKGMRLEEVSHLLGHASVTQTQKYAKFAKREVADRAREMLNGQ